MTRRSNLVRAPHLGPLLFLCLVSWTVPTVVFGFVLRQDLPPTLFRREDTFTTTCSMVRNIDLPEAVVFYGAQVLYDTKTNEWLPGISNILKECADVETPVLVLLDANTQNQKEDNQIPQDFPSPQHSEVIVQSTQHYPPLPNPRALYEKVQRLQIKPRSFGGSSGFGRRQWDEPRRPPLFPHVVVLCDSLPACRAARYAGARVVCLETNGNQRDNVLADAVVSSWEEITCLEDIATPGSFWLNPPHPKDDEGNRIDIDQVMEDYESSSESVAPSKPQQEESDGVDDDDDMSEDEVSRILADLDSL